VGPVDDADVDPDETAWSRATRARLLEKRLAPSATTWREASTLIATVRSIEIWKRLVHGPRGALADYEMSWYRDSWFLWAPT
jgi:hypothetical protein